MEISSIMFALLRSEIQETGLGEDVKNFITSEALPALFALSKKHDLAHLVGDALDRNGLLSEDSEMRKRFLRERSMAVYRYEQQQYDFEQICDTLEDAQIPFLPLKGSVLRGYYPEAWMRTSCDIDILVQADILDKAAQVVCDRLGYIRAEHPTAYELSLHTQSGVHIELHFDLTDGGLNECGREILSNILAYTEPTSGKAYQLQLNDDVFYFYHIAHMAKHFEHGGCGVRPFLDLWILNHRAGFDKQGGETLLQQNGLFTFAKACEKLSESWFGSADYDDVGRQMEDYLLVGGTYGTIENLVSIQQAKKGGKVKYLLSRIFISNKELRVKYPKLNDRPWLAPVYHVKRWLKPLTDKKTRKRSMHELEKTSNVTQDEKQAQEALLQRLGLKNERK